MIWPALDAVAAAEEATEAQLYSRLCDLASLDLRLVCYDLTSTYFEGPARPSDRFPSRAFGYSRDHRGDRPQIVIGLLCASDGIPVAHRVFAGNTSDASTLPAVLDDLARRFAVGRVCIVADRGLISTDNVEAVAAAVLDHVLATRLRRDHTAKEALAAVNEDTAWTEIEQHRCRAADVALPDGARAIVVESAARARRDTARTAEITAAGPIPFTPGDGNGLNPLLQHPIMAIHPPILYTGYVGFVIPFAFCVAALWTRRLDAAWIQNTRRWTLIAWFFLGSGILLGGRWAYVELGWGGYWGWDPVENAALMPWLTGTAFLHSVMIQERKGMLKIWNAGLVIVTYLLCVFGTFLTRSGIVSSVHAFASSEFAWRFLVFIIFAAILSAALLITRMKDLRTENELEAVVSRESGFLFNNLLLLAACFAVFWGTLFPVLSEAVQGEQISVGAPFFNRVNVPLGLALLLMTGVGPLLAWRRSSVDSLKRNFTVPLLSGVAAGLLLVALGMRHPYAILCFAMSAFVVVTIGTEFHRGVRARRAHRGGTYATALVDLVQRNTRRYGGYIVHFGIVLLFVGFAGNAFNKDVIADLNRGESTAIGPWKVTLQDLPSGETPVYNWLGAQVLLSKHDEPVGIFQPRRQLDKATGQATSEVRRHATFQEDIYLVFSGVTEDGRATVHVYRNPLVRWVWLGAFVMFLGTVLTLLPNRSPVRRTATAAPDGTALEAV